MFSSTSRRLTRYCRIKVVLLDIYRAKHSGVIFSLFFLLSACSSYISLIDDAPESVLLKSKRPRNLSCPHDAIATSTAEDNEILSSVFSSEKLSLEEEMIMAILQQMAVRPATSSPSARLQLALFKNERWQFYDYYQPAPAMPLWQGLQDLTTRLKLKPLSHYLKLAQKVYPRLMEIGPSFAQYLETYQEDLSQDQAEGPFFKAGQIIKSGESVPTPRWTQLPQKLKNNTSMAPLQTPIFASSAIKDAQVKCNFDMDLYSKSVYLVRPHPGANYNVFGRLKNNKEAFLVVTSVELQQPKPIGGTKTLLQQKPSANPTPMCLVDGQLQNQLLMLSMRGRDPGQHLYHLLLYSMSSANSTRDVEEYLAFPRHQFLYEPARMLYESSRGSINNMESFLRMDFPIYHSPKLGEVWAWTRFADKDQALSIDERYDAAIKCR